MDYSSTYFITLLVFTHDKLVEALKQLSFLGMESMLHQHPWLGQQMM